LPGEVKRKEKSLSIIKEKKGKNAAARGEQNVTPCRKKKMRTRKKSQKAPFPTQAQGKRERAGLHLFRGEERGEKKSGLRRKKKRSFIEQGKKRGLSFRGRAALGFDPQTPRGTSIGRGERGGKMDGPRELTP